MRPSRIAFALIAAGACILSLASVSARADSPLQSGVAAAIPPLPANSFITNAYIDVDGSAQQLKFNLSGSGGDVDMFVRYGTPFPEAQGNRISYDLLNRYAQYHSVSGESSESIVVLPSNRIPLHAGRWYIALINGGTSTANGTLTATAINAPAPVADIALDFGNPRAPSDPTNPKDACDDSFWTDTTVVAPVGGNPGKTLGEQRKLALQYATNELSKQLHIPVPISLHACGAHLGGDQNSATLAQAGPTSYFYDSPAYPINSLPKKYTWYPSTVAVRLNGTSMCGFAGGACNTASNDGIEATFNMDIGKPEVIGGQGFYFGYDPAQKPAGETDFITIAMHEITHGLGFLGLVNTDADQGPLGAKAGVTVDANGNGSIDYQNVTEGPFDDIYDDSVAIVNIDGGDYKPFLGYEVNSQGDADRGAALVSGATVNSPGKYIAGLSCLNYSGPCTGLRWLDEVAATSSINNNAGRPAPDDFPSLYAPCDKSATPRPANCATQPSSTLAHTTQTGDMMNAYYSNENLRNMGLAVPMLGPVGWSNAVATMPTFTEPMPGAWSDSTHSGHGFDFQLAAHDPVHGDIYVLTFYSFTATGTAEWYQASGRLIDGVFLPDLDANGNTLHRVLYSTTPTKINSVSLDGAVTGSVVVDFNQAANSPACRNIDRSSAAQLAVMYWTIDSDTSSWCMQPIVPLSAHASPDYNGLWYDTTDSGWGFELLDVANGNGDPTVNVLMYLPSASNTSTWAIGGGSLINGTAQISLQQVTNGYCRVCAPPANHAGVSIGTMTLQLQPISAGIAPHGTATISTSYPGGGGFNRSNVPVQMFSVPTGQ
ncbi:MAG TPA: hypothetical protein VFN13_01045 [Rudaea sp.]|nr:hypothetical protein [Rudaea sp.]